MNAGLKQGLIDYGVSYPEVMDRFVNDEDFYLECLGEFLYDDNFAGLGESLEAADAAGAFEHAHALKGAAANLGLAPLLALVNYMDARQALLWGFCLMLGAVSLLLYRETRSLLLALSFVFVISQLNPTAITASFQFSTCFFLAFGAMLCVLLLPTPRAADPLLFFLFGAATQFSASDAADAM